MAALQDFNTVGTAEDLLACCGSSRWAAEMLARRPFASASELIAAGSDVWFGLAEADWLEAFACHPRIGEVKPAATNFLSQSTTEQEAAQATIAQVVSQLEQGNLAYEAKFGFLYIVFASGRSAPELLAVLQSRLNNTRKQELNEAARQQDRITRLRMERWLK